MAPHPSDGACARADPGSASGAPATSKHWVWWGLALGVIAFTAGFGLGRGSVGRGSVDSALAAMARVPAHQVLPVHGAENAPVTAEAPPTVASVPEARIEPQLPEPAPRARTRASRPKPRARASAALDKPATGALSLAEPLQMLHRAERAIYSSKAAWAISLLDELDQRAPAAMLREERIATRVLALCADDQVESAEQLAARARREAPSSIYGALLLRACDTRGESGSQSTEPSSHQSTEPSSHQSTEPSSHSTRP